METLEDRRLLDGTQWLVVFRDLSLGTTLNEQAIGEQQFLYDHGIQDMTVTEAQDLDGTFLVQASNDATEDGLVAELQDLPGFAIVEEYDGRQTPSGTFDPGPPLDGLVPAPDDDSTPPPGSFNTTSLAPASLGHMMLLSNGTVMVQGSGISKTWYQLAPDINGNYANGTWSALASMGTERKDYASNVLPSGKVLIVGGEYSGPSGVKNVINTGEIYDPVTNSWSPIANFPQNAFGDDPTEILPDGRVLAGYIFGPQTYIYNPATNSWTQAGTKLRNDRSDEESWMKLPDGSVLSYDIWQSPDTGAGFSQRYVPSTNTWVDAGSVPVPLSGASVDTELGPGLQLPDGRVFLIGATSNTALYNPTTNSWTAGPTLPSGLGADDAPAALLPNGHVIFAADISNPTFTGPTHLFDFDPTAPIASSLTEITGQAGFPSQLTSDLDHAAFTTRMLVLPSGQILLNPGSSSRIWIYTPDGTPNSSWRPTITNVASNGGGTYTLTGTQINGLSEGASYGDDAEMSSNYPIVQLKNNSTGNIFYARTFNWSSTGIATGSTPETTQFTLPPGLPAGSYSLSVIANGIASAPAAFPINALYWDPNHTHAATGSGGSGTWNTTAANWFNGTTDVAWNNANNDTAIFAGSAGTVALSTGITARAIGFSTSGYTVGNNVLTLSGGGVDVASGLTETISSQIAGSAGLTLTGSGTTILTGTNTYSGTTTISAGTLQIGSGGTAGTLGSGSIINGAALRFNRTDSITVSSAISGTGSLTQAGTGTLILIGANTYGGTTTISAGTLQIGNGSAGGTPGTGAIGNSGALVINLSGSLTLPNLISGAGSLSLIGSGIVFLTAADTYTGPTTISSGTLQLGTGGGSVTIGSGAITNNGALVINRGGSLTLSNAITSSGSFSLIGSGTVILTGPDNFSGTTTISSGTLQIGTGGSAVTVGSGPIIDNGVLVINRGGTLTLGNLISGSGTLTKSGAGTITLSNPANNFTGTTNVTAGTLSVTGNLAPSSTTVTGGTLGGTGTTGDVTVNTGGALAPGVGPGIINTGNLVLSAGSNFAAEINSAVAGTGYDQANVTSVTLGGNLVLTGTRTDTTANVLTIINNAGDDPVNGIFAGLPEGSIVTLNNVMYSLSYQGGTGNDVTLTSIPAPQVVACSIAPGAILSPGSISIQITFSKPMKVANLDTTDFSLQGVFHGQIYSLNGFGFSPDGTVLTLNYTGLPDDAYTFTLVAGANNGANFTDVLGNALDGEFSGTFPSGNGVAGGNFVLNFSMDRDTEPYPVPVTATAPSGSLIYDPSVSRVIAYAGDTDSYTLAVDAGQTISVLVNQVNGSLRPAVELRDPANNLITSTNASTNLQPVFLNAVPATTSGTYTVTVSGSNANRGLYVLQVVLNSALEAENNGGAANDSIATAQNIDNSFVALSTSTVTASRGAALGGNAASAAWDDYYSFTVDANTQLDAAFKHLTGSGAKFSIENSSGAILAAGVTGAANYDLGTSALIATPGVYYLHVHGTAAATYSAILVKNAVFDTEANNSFATAQDITTDAGVLGAIVTQSGPLVVSTVVPNDLANTEGNSSSALLFGQASSHVQQIYSASQFASGGIIDSIRFRRNSAQGSFTTNGLIMQVDLAYAATTISTASNTFANNVGGGDVTVYNGPLTLSSSGSAGSGPNPFDVVIDVANTFNYNPALGDLLVDIRVLSNASQSFLLDAAPASQQSSMVQIHNVNVSNLAGNVGGTNDGAPFGLVTQFDFDAPTPEDGWYSINLANSSPNLQLETSTPAGGPNQFLNNLNPQLELYDPAGNLVASGTTLPDGRNESLQFHAPGLTPGTYRVRVTSQNASGGEYFLSSALLPNQLPIASDDSVSTNEDTSAVISVLTNDSDPDGSLDPSSITIGAAPSHGSLGVDSTTGQITYTPAANYSGSDSFTYTVEDDSGAVSNTATVNLSVVAVADPPSLAVTDAAGVEGTSAPLSIAAALLDTDGSERLSIQVAGLPPSAQLSAGTNNGDGSWTLAPGDLSDLSALFSDEGSFSLTITATSLENSNGDQAATMHTLLATIADATPTVASLAQASITTHENIAATNSGAFHDYDDPLTITASQGTLIDHHDGTWSWSGTGDEDHPYTVVVTATNSDASTASTSFDVSFTDVLPTVTADDATVTSDEGQLAANTGTFADYDDAVTLSVSEGTISQSGSVSGAWSWSNFYDDNGDHTIVVTALNVDGSTTTTSFTVHVNNVAPQADSTAPNSIVYGNAIVASLTNSQDSSTADTAAGFHYVFAVSTTNLSPLSSATYANSNDGPSDTFAGLNAGTYFLFSRIIDKDDGYTENSQSVTVVKAASTTAVVCTSSVTYNGEAQSPCTATVTGDGDLNQSLTIIYVSNINAGTATASAGFAGDTNHLASSDSTTFIIVKANATIVVTSYNVVFDGTAHTAVGTANGVLNESLSGLDVSSTTHTAVGVYIDAWTFTDTTGNYNDTSGAVVDIISPESLNDAALGILLLDAFHRGALTVTGNGAVKVIGTGGEIVVDSTNSQSVTVSGNGTVGATVVDAQGVSISGHASVQDGDNVFSYAYDADPLAALPPPAVPATTQSAITLNISGGQITLQPGLYIGGIQISGQANVTLAPGIYYLQGGGFSVSGQATVNGTDVMLYDAAATASDVISFSGQGDVNLSGLEGGVYQGLAIFQSRSSTAAISLSGQGNVNIMGSVYAASATLLLSGSGNLNLTGGLQSRYANSSQTAQLSDHLILSDLQVSGSGVVSVDVSHNTLTADLIDHIFSNY
ncbi:MAG TPA: autotransporter-associated beta strand repeat-containing protein [Pirellulaceae bacterium]|jgi:autotransporter-associated beta strand protein